MSEKSESTESSSARPRIRDLDAPPASFPTGRENSITDVPTVSVGHKTISENAPSSSSCKRTGVTAIHPTDKYSYEQPVTGATHIINGFGKSTGIPQINELGKMETPILLTNTLSTWRVADTVVSYIIDSDSDARSINPVVGECNDGRLNDIRGRHVTSAHVREAMQKATSPNVAEGCVGAGTGMTGFGWKAGIGTSSRVVLIDDKKHTVGVMSLTNTGRPENLRINGVPVGEQLQPSVDHSNEKPIAGSIIIVVGTDAPLTARQLSRIAKRGSLGLGRVGATAYHESGDFVIAFSNEKPTSIHDDSVISPLLRATVEATEEAIYNSLLRATTTVGIDETVYEAIPVDELRELL